MPGFIRVHHYKSHPRTGCQETCKFLAKYEMQVILLMYVQLKMISSLNGRSERGGSEEVQHVVEVEGFPHMNLVFRAG